MIFSLDVKSCKVSSYCLIQNFPKNIRCKVQRKYPAPNINPNVAKPANHLGTSVLLNAPIKVKISPMNPENAGKPKDAKNAMAVISVNNGNLLARP